MPHDTCNTGADSPQRGQDGRDNKLDLTILTAGRTGDGGVMPNDHPGVESSDIEQGVCDPLEVDNEQLDQHRSFPTTAGAVQMGLSRLHGPVDSATFSRAEESYAYLSPVMVMEGQNQDARSVLTSSASASSSSTTTTPPPPFDTQAKLHACNRIQRQVQSPELSYRAAVQNQVYSSNEAFSITVDGTAPVGALTTEVQTDVLTVIPPNTLSLSPVQPHRRINTSESVRQGASVAGEESIEVCGAILSKSTSVTVEPEAHLRTGQVSEQEEALARYVSFPPAPQLQLQHIGLSEDDGDANISADNSGIGHVDGMVLTQY